MNPCFSSTRKSVSSKLRFIASLFGALLLTQSAFAFFPAPDPLNLEVGDTGIINVNCPPGESGLIKVTSIFVSPIVGIQINTPLPKSGPNTVPISVTGLAPGTYLISFIGRYKFDTPLGDTSGSSIIIVGSGISTSSQIPQIATAGDPINTSTGEYFGSEGVDLNLGGPMPLLFSRYVASELATDNVADGKLGQNRLHNFASTMSLGATEKQIILPNGRRLTFKKTGTKWNLTKPLDVPYLLVASGANFILGHPHTQQMWTYNNQGQLAKIEDGRGNTHTLTYDGGGLLTGVIDGLGRSLAFIYASGRIATITGEPGARLVTFSYTGNVLTSATDQGGHTTLYGQTGGRPTSITRPEGNVLFTQIYTDGKVTSQTERGTDTSTLDYDDDTTTFTDPTAATLVDNYASGRLISHVDQGGKAITMTHDAAGRRNSVTDRLGDKTSFTFHALTGLPATITNAAGGITAMTYKLRTLSGLTFHDLSKVAYPDGGSHAYTYDAKGNMTQITDQAGKIWKFTYNTRGQVLTATNPLGGISIYQYDNATGNLTSSKDHDTDPTTYLYDARNRLIQITRPNTSSVVIGYNTKDLITSITDERGKIYTYAYDTNNRLTTVTDPDTKTTTMAYDALDRVIEIIDRNGQDTDMVYDSRRLLSSVTDRNGNTTTYEYDARQRLITTTNAAAQDWPMTYDDEGLLTSSSTPLDPPYRIKRNRLGQPVELINPLGHTSFLGRDAMQRVTRFLDPLGRQTLYTYDKRGLLISVTEQGTAAAKYDRDGLGALTKITDPGGGAWSFTYTKGGRLASITDPLSKKTTHTYDTSGRLSVTTLPTTPPAAAATITRTYDAASNLTQTLYSAGPTLDFGYDNLNRLTSTNGLELSYDGEDRITNARQNGFDFDATYDNDGRLATVSYLSGASTVTYEYDTRDRLIRVTDNNTTVQIDFTYDDADRLTGITRTNNVNSTFTYDAAGRLMRIQEGSIINLVYNHDAAGQVVGIDFTAPEFPAVTAAPPALLKFDKASRITATGYVYDLLGQLTAALGRVYGWDGASRLTNANGVTLAYNGLDDVILRTSGANVTRFYHHQAIDLAPIVYENPEAGGGNPRAYVWTPEGKLLYSFDTVTLQPAYYHFDHVGTTLALTDAGGSVTDSYAYGPFGEMLNHTGPSTQPFTYIGAWGVRTEGTLCHMRSRYYDPTSARFLSRDTYPPDLSRPQTLNPYQYAVNNPLSFIDPEGTDPSLCDFSCDSSPQPKKKKKKKTKEERKAERERRRVAMIRALFKDPGDQPPPKPTIFILDVFGNPNVSGCPDSFPGSLPCGFPPSTDTIRGQAFPGTGDTLTIPNSTLTGNQASGGGGGIWSASPSPVVVLNSTLTGNEPSGGKGGGIISNSPLTIVNSTISGNQTKAPAINPTTGLPKGVNAFGAQFLAPAGSDPNAPDRFKGDLVIPGVGAAPAR